MCITCPVQLIFLDLVNPTKSGEEHTFPYYVLFFILLLLLSYVKYCLQTTSSNGIKKLLWNSYLYLPMLSFFRTVLTGFP
jgi:hypothetical protein